MVINQGMLTEAGVTTPTSVPLDTNGRDIKTAKVVKDAHYQISKRKLLTNQLPQKVSGMLYTKGVYESNVKSYING